MSRISPPLRAAFPFRQEKPPKDEIEERLRTAINLQEMRRKVLTNGGLLQPFFWYGRFPLDPQETAATRRMPIEGFLPSGGLGRSLGLSRKRFRIFPNLIGISIGNRAS